MNKTCKTCGIVFYVSPCRKGTAKYCSYSCSAKDRKPRLGTKTSAEGLNNMSKSRIGKSFMTKEGKEKTRQRMLGNKYMEGKKPGNYLVDRTKLAKKQERNDPTYKEWRRQVWLRDKFACKIGNPDCCGRIEAHHILSWKDYPELRYEVNNGITLCHFHHPKRREEEKRLSPYFQELVSVSKH